LPKFKEEFNNIREKEILMQKQLESNDEA